jgi:hypothetical protein
LKPKNFQFKKKDVFACFVLLAWYKKGMEEKKATFLTNAITFFEKGGG